MRIVNTYEVTNPDGARRRTSLYSFTNLSLGRIMAYMVIYQKNNDPKEYFCLPDATAGYDVKKMASEALYDGKSDVGYRLQTILMLLSPAMKW